MANRAFRFGLQIREVAAADLPALARSAETAGYDVLSTFDHVGTAWSPLEPLLAAALATERLRVCPLVLNNDFWHPVHLARAAATIDHLTGGRLELGIGAGHSFTEYASIGEHFDAPAVRKQRMGEAVEILGLLLAGEEVTWDTAHHQLHAVSTLRALQERLPILVGVNGRAGLAHAARHADTIGLTMLGRTLEDGHSHEVRWDAGRVDAAVALVGAESAAAGRPMPELNALVQAVTVTADRRAAAEELAGQVPGLTVDDALAAPFLMLGTHDEMADHARACRDRWGISYFTVRDLEGFAPVIERLRADARR